MIGAHAPRVVCALPLAGADGSLRVSSSELAKVLWRLEPTVTATVSCTASDLTRASFARAAELSVRCSVAIVDPLILKLIRASDRAGVSADTPTKS